MHIDGTPLFAEEPYSLVPNVKTAFDAVQLLRNVSRAYGFSHFSVLSIPSSGAPTEISLARLSTVSSLPAELVGELDRLNRDDTTGGGSIIGRLHGKMTPLVYRIDDSEETGGERDRLLKRFNIAGGIYFPVHDARGNLQAVSYHGERGALDADEVARLGLFSALIVERLAEVASYTESQPRVALSPRETEVLRWTAEGKTSSEIAIIAGLSEHTVNHYVTLATQKLGCANRTQAVVRAIRLGLFS